MANSKVHDGLVFKLEAWCHGAGFLVTSLWQTALWVIVYT